MDQKKGIAEDQDGLLTFDPTPHDDIQACTQAMGVIEDLDLVLMLPVGCHFRKTILIIIKRLRNILRVSAFF